MEYQGEFIEVFEDSSEDKNAKVVCRQLGFPGLVKKMNVFEVPRGYGNRWFDKIVCDGTEEGLSCCQNGNLTTEGDDDSVRYDLAVICEPGIKLNKVQLSRFLR